MDLGPSAAAKKLWDQAMDLGGTGCINHPAARAYFEARGIDLDSLPAWSRREAPGRLPLSIRYHPAAPYAVAGFDRKVDPGPCLLFQVVDAQGNFRNVHRIFLELDGSPRKRSDVPNAKLTCSGGVAGCAIRFGDPYESEVLPVGEGPETMLAVAAACGVPAWSTISGPGLMSLELPESLIAAETQIVKCIAIMGDHDRAGLSKDDVLGRKVMMRPGWNFAAPAALRLEEKYKKFKLDVVIAVPGIGPAKPPLLKERGDNDLDAFAEIAGDRKGVDWLDVYCAHGADAVMQALGSAKRLDDIPIEYLASSPVAKAWLANGVPTKYLLNASEQDEYNEKEEKRKAREDKEEQKRIERESVRPEDMFPKGTADRAEFALKRVYMPDKTAGERWRLAYWIENSQWMVWTGQRYRLLKEHEVATDMAPKLRGLKQENRTGKVVDVDLTTRGCEDIAKMLQSQVTVRGDGLPFMAPATFDVTGEPIWKTSVEQLTAGSDDSEDDAKNLLGLDNGMLSLSDFERGKVKMVPHSPRIISRSLVPFALDTKALQSELDKDPQGDFRGGELVGSLCPTWLRILDEAFDGDEESIGELQKVAGYLLTEDMSHEVMPIVVGPPRSGKGVITLGISLGIGEDRVATTNFTSFGDKNETYNLVGRRAAFMTDAQQADPRDMHKIVEKLKTITGGDPQSVEGKFKDKNPYIYLPVIPFIVANTVPKLIDPSNALAARVLMFKTRQSFVGREDRTLKKKIRAEAHGIMLWALFGLRAMRRDGKFVQPAASRKLLEQFKRLSSPMSAFLNDACVVHEPSEASFNVMYTLYKAWAEDSGHGRPSKEKFFSDLQANIPAIDEIRRYVGRDKRLTRVLKGVRPRLYQEVILPDTKPDTHAVLTWDPNTLATFEFNLPGSDGGDDKGGGETRYPDAAQGEFGM